MQRAQRNADRAIAAIVAVALVVYVWIISAGHFTTWPTYSHYHSYLSEAFLQGQTSLLIRPSPQLLALADPYDPARNIPYIVVDLSLYHGKYYLYWGPTPALLISIVRWPLASFLPKHIGDQYCAFAFTAGTMLTSVLLVRWIYRRLFPTQRWWEVGIACFAVAFATPMLFVLGWASVYQAALMGGQFFAVTGIACATVGCDGGARARWLAAAGFCWALCLGARFSLAPGLFILAALTLLRVWRMHTGSRLALVGRAACVVVPMSMALVLLGLYNKVRFDSWTEFGVTYQLMSFDGVRLPQSALFSWKHIGPALERYLFAGVEFRPWFPFIRCAHASRAWRQSLGLDHTYITDPVTGLAWCLPFAVFALFAVVKLLRSAIAMVRKRDVTPIVADQRLWFITCLSAFIVTVAIPLFEFQSSSMRYLADLTPALLLLAVIGWWHLLAAVGQRRWLRQSVVSIATILILWSAVVGLLLSITSQFRHFEQHNLGLYRWMAHHICIQPPPADWDDGLPTGRTANVEDFRRI